jgi:REP element-mobilizing transposase RayT
MLYRDYKTFVPSNYYHVFNRGNNKNDIYLDSQDYGVFMRRVTENFFPENEVPKEMPLLDLKNIYKRKLLPARAFSLICYCLMPNHFHLLIRQDGDVKISKLIQKLCTGYAKYFQKKYNHTGHLFQGAFKAIHIDNESYLMWLSAYIHQNPGVAGLVKNIEDYPYSSYVDYIGKRNGNLCTKDVILDKFKIPGSYKKFVEDSGELIKQRKEIQSLLLD